MGWPWPWDDSRTTDYAYALDDGVIYGSAFGHAWFRVDPTAENWGEEESSDKSAVFPNMASVSRFTSGPRSGVIIMGGES